MRLCFLPTCASLLCPADGAFFVGGLAPDVALHVTTSGGRRDGGITTQVNAPASSGWCIHDPLHVGPRLRHPATSSHARRPPAAGDALDGRMSHPRVPSAGLGFCYRGVTGLSCIRVVSGRVRGNCCKAALMCGDHTFHHACSARFLRPFKSGSVVPIKDEGAVGGGANSGGFGLSVRMVYRMMAARLYWWSASWSASWSALSASRWY